MHESSAGEAWVVVLAGDEIWEGPSPFRSAVSTARCLTGGDMSRVVAVVPRRRAELARTAEPLLHEDNVLLEPASRGTAAAALLAVMHLLRVAPGATAVFVDARDPGHASPRRRAALIGAVKVARGLKSAVVATPGGTVGRLSAVLRAYEDGAPWMGRLFLAELGRGSRWRPIQVARLFQMLPARDLQDVVAARHEARAQAS